MSKILLLGSNFQSKQLLFRKKVAEFLKKDGHQPILLEQKLKAGDHIVDKINKLLKETDRIILLINEDFNPDTAFFELGFLMGNKGSNFLSKNMLVLFDDKTDLSKFSSLLKMNINKFSHARFDNTSKTTEKILEFVNK